MVIGVTVLPACTDLYLVVASRDCGVLTEAELQTVYTIHTRSIHGTDATDCTEDAATEA
jgi:hypothetical protein